MFKRKTSDPEVEDLTGEVTTSPRGEVLQSYLNTATKPQKVYEDLLRLETGGSKYFSLFKPVLAKKTSGEAALCWLQCRAVGCGKLLSPSRVRFAQQRSAYS